MTPNSLRAGLLRNLPRVRTSRAFVTLLRSHGLGAIKGGGINLRGALVVRGFRGFEVLRAGLGARSLSEWPKIL